MTQAAIEFSNVSYTYPGASEPAVLDITLRVGEGEYMGLIGPNGAGKTTLINLLTGRLDGATGKISVFGSTPQHAARAGLVGHVPQSSEATLSFPASCRQVIAMGAAARLPGWRGLGADRRAWIERCLELTGATAFADAPIGEVSGGQRQRVLIGRALACKPRLLIFDEPTAGIDAVGSRQFADLVSSLHDELGLTILLVSHDIRAIVRGAVACERVACLRQSIHFHEAPGGLTPRVLGEVFEHDLSDVFGDVHVDAHTVDQCHHHGHTHGPDAADRGAPS